MRKLWYKYNLWWWNKMADKCCNTCFAFSPCICDGLDGEESDMCPRLKYIREQIRHFQICLDLYEENEALKNKMR